MTVEVETPGGVATGSSVIQVDITEVGKGPLKLPDASGTSRLLGEAAAVELPGGKVLFALLEKPGGVGDLELFPVYAFKPTLPPGNYPFIQRAKNMKEIRRVGVLPRDSYPYLVTFGDVTDPTTIQRVDPDDLAATFGEGVSVRRITIQMTNDPISTGISRRLPWLGKIDEQTFKKMPREVPMGNFTGLFMRDGG